MTLTSNNFWKEAPTPNLMQPGSPYCSLHRAAGELAYNDVTIAGTGGEVVTNVFSYTAPFELVSLYAVFTDVSDVTTANGVYFDAWDGANSIPITADGLNCNGVGANAIILKDQVLAQTLRLLDSDQAYYQESAVNNPREFQGGLVQAKASTTCYVRLRMDTDGDTDCTLRVYMSWVCRCSGDVGVEVV